MSMNRRTFCKTIAAAFVGSNFLLKGKAGASVTAPVEPERLQGWRTGLGSPLYEGVSGYPSRFPPQKETKV